MFNIESDEALFYLEMGLKEEDEDIVQCFIF